MHPFLGLELAKEINRDRLAQAEVRRTARLVRTPLFARLGRRAKNLPARARPARRTGTRDGSLRADGLHCVSGISLGSVVLDCPDPAELAEFYRGVLGGEVRSDRDDWVDLVVPGATTLSFQKVQSYTPPSWPDGPPQQFHLDLAGRGVRRPSRAGHLAGRKAPRSRGAAPGRGRPHLAGVRRPGRPPVLPVHVLRPCALRWAGVISSTK